MLQVVQSVAMPDSYQYRSYHRPLIPRTNNSDRRTRKVKKAAVNRDESVARCFSDYHCNDSCGGPLSSTIIA